MSFDDGNRNIKFLECDYLLVQRCVKLTVALGTTFFGFKKNLNWTSWFMLFPIMSFFVLSPILVLFWTNFNPVLLRSCFILFRSCLSSVSVLFWSCFGLVLVLVWSCFGPDSFLFRSSCFGPVLVQFRSCFGLISVLFQSCFCPVLFWSYFALSRGLRYTETFLT